MLIAKDKHFCVCLIASLIHPWLAVGLALGKEYGDAVGNRWSWGDIIADGVGIFVGTLMRFFIFTLY
jgi:hypothetical protein